MHLTLPPAPPPPNTHREEGSSMPVSWWTTRSSKAAGDFGNSGQTCFLNDKEVSGLGIGPRVVTGFAADQSRTSRQPRTRRHAALRTLCYLLVARDGVHFPASSNRCITKENPAIPQQHCAICGRKFHSRVILIQGFS